MFFDSEVEIYYDLLKNDQILLQCKYIFEISIKRRIFDALFDLFKEKKFSSLRRDDELFFLTEKVKNARNR
jgi:hypothetical protein